MMTKSVLRAIALVAFAAATANSWAGGTSWPLETTFQFLGWRDHPGAPINLKVCSPNTNGGECASNTAQPVGTNTYVLGAKFQDLRNGQAVRGTNASADSGGTSRYQIIEFELDSGTFFHTNPEAHIAVVPRGFLPHEPNSSYPPFQTMTADVTIPYAYGNGIILGKSPCTLNGISIEHFYGPSSPNNVVLCPTGQLSFQPYSTYAVKVAVKQAPCPSPNESVVCRWVGYRIDRIGSAWGVQPWAQGGADNATLDNSAASYPPRGWNTLQAVDRASWYIAHVFTTTAVANWNFEVRNVQVSLAFTPPSWWSGEP